MKQLIATLYCVHNILHNYPYFLHIYHYEVTDLDASGDVDVFILLR